MVSLLFTGMQQPVIKVTGKKIIRTHLRDMRWHESMRKRHTMYIFVSLSVKWNTYRIVHHETALISSASSKAGANKHDKRHFSVVSQKTFHYFPCVSYLCLSIKYHWSKYRHNRQNISLFVIYLSSIYIVVVVVSKECRLSISCCYGNWLGLSSLPAACNVLYLVFTANQSVSSLFL